MYFPIAIEHPANNNEAYGIIVPDIPGCHAAGDTLDEAIESAIEAITEHLEILVENGEELPSPSDLASIAKQDDFAGMALYLADIDASRYLGSAVKINVTLPSRLLHLIDDRVAANKLKYKSRSGYLAKLAEADLLIKNESI